MEKREEVSNDTIMMCILAACTSWLIIGAIACCAIIFSSI